jgi:2,6-dihydroxypyridine 3-monooxygenase
MGGSLGGLTAGLVLRDVGCDVHVFERSSVALQQRGAGIAVLDATIRYFVENHVLDDVDQICTSTGWIRYLHPDGSTRYEEPHRYRFSSWNTIYRSLKTRLGERYHLGKEVIEFDQDGDGVTVRFADGEVSTWDMLMCADGGGSMARRRLLSDVGPSYAGYVAWRGTVPETELGAEAFRILHDAITYQLMPNGHILVYPIPNVDGSCEPGRRLMNFVWYRNVAEAIELEALMTDRVRQLRSVSLPPGAVQDCYLDEIRAVARDAMAAPIAEVVAKTAQPFVQVIVDVEVSAMVFGRICLIGDAAFTVRPHAGAGTAKACADAWAMAEAMAATDGDVEKALKLWEPGQVALGCELLARARDAGNRSQFLGTWVPGDPTLIFGLYGPGR